MIFRICPRDANGVADDILEGEAQDMNDDLFVHVDSLDLLPISFFV